MSDEARRLAKALKRIEQLEEQLTGSQMREQEVANKWRVRYQAVVNELYLAQKGLTSGCGCPIGQCQRRGVDEGSCWLQWAEGHVLKRMASQRIDEIMRAGNHPSRFRKLFDATQAATRVEPDGPTALPAPEGPGNPPE